MLKAAVDQTKSPLHQQTSPLVAKTITPPGIEFLQIFCKFSLQGGIFLYKESQILQKALLKLAKQYWKGVLREYFSEISWPNARSYG